MKSSDWRPTASISLLKQRANLITSIRRFFAERDVLEVETPALSHHTVTDVHLEAMQTVHTDPTSSDKRVLYLQTSPEFAMKRLLAAGSGCIYQICKSFRDDEVGNRHNPEFTMLEWYRVGFSMQDLIDEVAQLLLVTLKCFDTSDIRQITYRQLFIQSLGIDPIADKLPALIKCADRHGYENLTKDMVLSNTASQIADKDMLLQLLFSHCIEPTLGFDKPCVVTHFPESQAALAKVDDEDSNVALRFEVYVQGIELANGYEELINARLQYHRMVQDNQTRTLLSKTTKEIDAHLICALEHGLPQCSGVALGVDRLMMISSHSSKVADVMAFSIENA